MNHPTINELGIDRLPLDQRIALVQEIWDSIAADARKLPPDADEAAELVRRLVADDNSPEAVVGWESIRQDAAERWKR